MDTKYAKLYQSLKIYFTASIILCGIAFILAFHITTKNQISEPDILLERYAIMLMLIGIPVSLRLFYKKTNNLQKSDENTYLSKYRLHYIIRLSIIDLICLFNISALYITGSRNFVYMSLITILVFFFCIPQKINKLADNNETTEDSGIDEEQ